ncbi:hypothetical protein M409DRAFT_17310 [Zasmidium cellare ATCC 36951]|uniref:PHD-type domain-containing protein n=1 Tax=Zasmidium cellare ATCC 36951 TaxID=1080233 RepID=A0A6A6D0X1_ZASCE|nr:uncharacterized protein M409DRAFT_17310 [Zasmidium cellare ATCC 36951]KAF2172068.1 hypothetical protein M409DRAFT_17310 [Zasmidium cellare ATCC 36951]
MSLSLSSLLNPSPESAARGDEQSQNSALPPIQQVQSPEEQNQRPSSARSNEQHQSSHPTSSTQEAAQALASLSESPAPPPQQWNGYSAQDQNGLERTRSWERRPSAYGDPIQLPPPVAGVARKTSSPTLDQYHVASRSPEQRRASVISPEQSNFTLPPIQNYTQPSDQRHESHAAQPPASNPRDIETHAAPSSSSGAQDAEAQAYSHGEPAVQLKHQSSTAEEGISTPALIKQESAPTPQPSSPTDTRRPSEMDASVKAVSALKNEHGLRQSPLRESSVPVPTTETVPEAQSVVPKKRPAPAKTKKGTATTMKKAPPAKKRKVEPKRSATPSSRASKVPTLKGSSAKGTPANSSPAPSTRSYSAEPNEDPYDDEDEDMEDISDSDVYCICRKPDNGTFMIGCDGTCDDWYHGKCVGIQERDKNLIDKYICPSCEKSGKVGQTTWKRMCRRGGCRQPARVGKSKSGSKGSKYCSDECGLLYYREMVARSRGREDSLKHRSSRRKPSIADSEQGGADDDLGARGGALSAGEVKALLNVSKTADDFRKLGDGVLSPPATPDGKEQDKKGSEFTDSEHEALQRILGEKEEARHRHATLKDCLKFVTMVKQAASRVVAEKELKAKDYCGYDPRLEWTEDRFQEWRKSEAGQKAFQQETLQPAEKSNEEDEAPGICDRKKCARHHDWNKLAVDDLRFEMQDNGDRMRGLDREEKEIKERAAMRAKAGKMEGEGTVEVHGLGISTESQPVLAAHGVSEVAKTNGFAETTVEAGEPMVIDTA